MPRRSHIWQRTRSRISWPLPGARSESTGSDALAIDRSGVSYAGRRREHLFVDGADEGDGGFPVMALLESLFRIIDASVLLPALFAILPLRSQLPVFQP